MDEQVTSQSNNLQEQQAPQTTTRLRILIIVLLAVFLLSAVGIGTYFLGKKSAQPVQTSTNSVVETTPTPTPNPTASWKTHSNLKFSVKYPPDWTLETNEYLQNGFQISNPNRTVGITVTEFQYPYSMVGTNEAKEQLLTLSINGKNYQAIEYVVSDTRAYVDLKIETNTSQEYHILFGTGYPTTPSDGKASITDYNKDKGSVLQILSTLKFDD